jgi:pimeloyl-ACP methyl ester carboxylesterase
VAAHLNGAAEAHLADLPWQDHFFASADGLRLYYRDYPAQVSPGASPRAPVLCLPGLTRNSRDFESLATHLARERRVLSPDLRGRGRSQYDPEWRNYHPGTYVVDLGLLLAAAGVARVVVIGTSLGGLLAMLLAASRPQSLCGAVLNDIGPEVEAEGIARISGYVGRGAPVATWEAAAAQVRAINEAAFPDLTDAEWLAFARRTCREVDGVIRVDMDPMIGEAVRASPAGAAPDLWPVYAALAPLPVLAIRGELSDVLSTATFDRMLREKPDLLRVLVPRRGHAPSLDEPECRAAIDAFLEGLPC